VRVRFVRIAGEADRVYVTRSNGTETWWTFPSYGKEIPHDMIHHVVESHFGLKQGFWGRVDAGVDPARVSQEANRKGGKEKYRAFGDDLTELYLAEALANLSWSLPELSIDDRHALFLKNCEQSSIQPPANVTTDALAAAKDRIDELRGRWRALVPKGTIELTF
jgi:hypothetical protein